MKSIITKDFNLRYTLESGQFFRWWKEKDFYVVVSGMNVIKVKQEKNVLLYSGCSEKFLQDFFRLGFLLEEIEGFRKFPFLRKIFHEFYGLRLIKMNLWECILSYILSINSQIKTIQNNLNWLATRYGTKRDKYHLLPSCIEFQKIKVFPRFFGLRRKFLKKLADNYLTIKNELTDKLSYSDKKKLLMSIYGIGDKVSECILLYSLNEDNAFPVDRWVVRFLRRYFNLDIKCPRKIREWAQKTFGKNCGWLQQYIYIYARKYCIR
ncbi:MAG: DNA-3-methyladenine glycosylase family protein [Planctomycetota bacterium]